MQGRSSFEHTQFILTTQAPLLSAMLAKTQFKKFGPKSLENLGKDAMIISTAFHIFSCHEIITQMQGTDIIRQTGMSPSVATDLCRIIEATKTWLTPTALKIWRSFILPSFQQERMIYGMQLSKYHQPLHCNILRTPSPMSK